MTLQNYLKHNIPPAAVQYIRQHRFNLAAVSSGPRYAGIRKQTLTHDMIFKFVC